jgi:hypothetical protein
MLIPPDGFTFQGSTGGQPGILALQAAFGSLPPAAPAAVVTNTTAFPGNPRKAL